MNFDRFVILLSLSFLPILWLPQKGFIVVYSFACILVFIGGLNKKYLTIVLGVLIGISYWQVQQIAKNAEKPTASKAVYTFRIDKILKQTDYQTAIARLENGERIYLTWQSDTPLLPARTYQAKFSIRPVSARANMGNFNRQRWYFAQHLNGIATVKQAELSETTSASLRDRWLERAARQLTDFPGKGLLLALAFGERAWLEESTWQRFQQTSTAHLIAISGLHIGLAMGIGFWCAKLFQWVLLRLRIGRALGFSLLFPRVSGFVLAVFYSYLAGFAVPTVRALLAISLILLCQYLRRHYTAWQLWWRVVALLLVLDPIAILSDSFWLSVLAVLSLIIWYRYFPLADLAWLIGKKQGKFNRLCFSLLHLQTGILLVFSPVQLFFFEGISPFAFLANVLIVPLYSVLLVPCVLFALLTDNLFHSWQFADWLAQKSIALLAPMASDWVVLDQMQQGELLTFNLLLLLILYYGKTNRIKRGWKTIVLFPGVLMIIFWGKRFCQPAAEWITFDVGQGLAQALIYQTSGQKKAVFYDTGASWKNQSGQRSSMAQLEILPYLKRNGIEVEAIFLSHDDNDHSGGVADLLTAFPHARLISSSHLHYAQHSPEACIAGQHWQFGPFMLSAVYPAAPVARAKNADSCILLVKNDHLSLLLTGDTTLEQERLFAHRMGKVDFLQVPHHGSKTSTGFTLLAQTKPDVAIISVGRWNPWKMPHKQVVTRLEKQQIKVLATSESGMIRVAFNHGHWRLNTARHAWSPWYNAVYGQGKDK